MSNTREKEDQDSDWENARNWLIHPDVTRMSAKVIEALFKVKKKVKPCISNIHTPIQLKIIWTGLNSFLSSNRSELILSLRCLVSLTSLPNTSCTST